jgi:hypothetical protein
MKQMMPGVDLLHRHTMRFLIVAVAVSPLAFASGAFAQTAPQSSPAPPSGGTGGGLETEQRGHPNWFTEPNPYKPCPASVVLAVLCLQTGAMFALAAPRRVGRTSRLAQLLLPVPTLCSYCNALAPSKGQPIRGAVAALTPNRLAIAPSTRRRTPRSWSKI